MHATDLIVEPEDGAAPLLNAIRHARRTIDITIFRFDHQGIAAALEAAVARGVQIRALIAFSNGEGTRSLRELEWRLLDVGVTVSRTSDSFSRYHAKIMIVDGRTLHVLGFNYTRLDLQSRSFGIVTTSQPLVQQAIKLFEADLTRRPFTGGSGGLIVCPENGRERLEAFVQGARHQLLIYDTKLADRRVLQLLEDRVKANVDVRIIGRLEKHRALPVAKLRGRRMHVRAIVRDSSKVFIGSQSLHKSALDARREVGVIVDAPDVVRQMCLIFEHDWPHEHEAVLRLVGTAAPAPTR